MPLGDVLEILEFISFKMPESSLRPTAEDIQFNLTGNFRYI